MATPPAGDKKNIVKLAYLYIQEGRWDNAIEEYQKLLELDPEDMNIHNMLGDVYVKKNSAALAYEKYNKVAEDLVSRGQMDKAVMIHRKIARLDSSQLTLEAQQKQNLIQLHMKADDSMEEGRVEEAIEAFSEILKLSPDDLIVASKLAELDEKVGRIQDSVQQYLQLGDSFMKSHLFKKAQEMYKKVAAMDPQNTVAHLNLAQIYLKQGSENDAKKEYLNVSENALAKNDLEVAQENATKAVELKSIEAHYILGVVLFKKNQWNEAKTEFDNLLRFKVNHVGALVYLGKVFAALNQNEKAAENFQKALKADKDNPVAVEAWADFNIAHKNKKEAVAALAPIVDRYLAGGDDALAVEWARKLVAADDSLIPSRLKLAQALDKSGDANGAADVYYELSILSQGQNNAAEAEEYLKKTLELNPTHPKASAGQAAVVETPEPVPEPAIEEVPAAVSQAQVGNASPQEAFKAQLAVADQYVKQGLLDEGIELYQQLLEVEPENDEVKKKLNSVYAAYAKTGTDLTGVFAQTAKAPEESKKPTVAPAAPAATVSTPAPVAAAQPVPKAAVDDAAKKNLKELEAKAREEADKRVRAELEKRAREEADKRANEEIKRLAEEKEKKVQAQAKAEAAEAEAKAAKAAEEKPAPTVSTAPAPAVEPSAQKEAPAKPLPAIGGLDDMFATAEADLLHSKGKDEEAAKIYREVLKAHPDNQTVKKKLETIEATLNSKKEPAPASAPPAAKNPPVLKVVEPPPAVKSAPENDSNIKKKSNKIGYV